MNAFNVYCDYQGIAEDPDAYGTEFRQYFVGEIDIEEYLRCKLEDSNLPKNILKYLDFDQMASDELKQKNFVQLGKYLFRA